VLRLAVVGLLARVALAIALACLLAACLTLVRSDASSVDGFRVSVWLVGCVLLLLAFAGSSPTMRGGTIDPYGASFFPKLRPRMTDEYSGTRVSSGALFVLSALALFALGFLLS